MSAVGEKDSQIRAREYFWTSLPTFNFCDGDELLESPKVQNNLTGDDQRSMQ